MNESLQTSARIPSTLTTQEGFSLDMASSGCRIHPQSGQARLEGDELAGTAKHYYRRKRSSASEAWLPRSHPITSRHSWKARGTVRCHSNSRWPGHSARCTEGSMKLHRVGGGRLYLGALHFWVPDKQLHVRVFISHLAQRHSLFCSEENPS